MSADNDFHGAWTDDEIDYRLPFLFKKSTRLVEELKKEQKNNAEKTSTPFFNNSKTYIATSFELSVSKAIYPLKNHKAIQQKVIRMLLQHGITIAIRRYGRTESLPRRYQLLAQNSDCLTLLVQDFFLRSVQIKITPEMNLRISDIVTNLEKKDESKIAYQRVSELRDFIHDEVVQAKGERWALLCDLCDREEDREEMRLLLSTARLHLCINELIKHHSLDLTALHKRYISMAAVEAAMPTTNTLPFKKNIHRWRVRHYRSLLYYFPLEIRQTLLDYMQQRGCFADDDIQEIEEYKKALLTYCRQCVEGYLIKKEMPIKAKWILKQKRKS